MIFTERLLYPDKYSWGWGISYEDSSAWLEPTKGKIARSCLCHTIFTNFQSYLYHKQKKLSRFLLLTIFLLRGLFLLLIQQSLFNILLNVLRVLFRVHSGRFLSYSKKKENKPNDHLLWLVVIRCQSLSFFITRYLSPVFL